MAATEQETTPADVVEHAMRVAREFCGLELAYVAEFLDGTQVIRDHVGDEAAFSVPLDVPIPLEETYCQRVVDGRLPQVVPDAAADPTVGTIRLTAAAGIGAYVGAPIRLPDGALYGTLCCLSPSPHPELSDRHGELLRLLASLIGNHIAREQEATEALRSQNEFLETVSHDLRTPLRAVSFIAEDLAAGDETLETGPAAQAILEEVDSVMGMVDDVLMVARQRTGSLVITPETTDLTQVAERAVRSSAAAAGPDGDRIEAVLPDLPLPAFVDPGRVAQAVRNLLDNALKYSPDGQPVHLRLRRDDTTAVFEVEDRGIGVPEADLERLGERFFRSTSARERGIDGIGLGLASAQAIAEAHEGVLSCTSTPGEGSVFRLRLPLLRAV